MSDGLEYVSTAQVSAALKVSVSTIKRWVDGGVLPAYRTAGGHRKLLLSDITRLVREGVLPHGDLTQLNALARSSQTTLDPDATSRPLIPNPNIKPLAWGQHQTRLMEALKSGDDAAARALVRSVRQNGASFAALGDFLLAPVLHQIGHEWERGEIEVFHEHRASQICASILFELRAERIAASHAPRPLSVGGSPEGDLYLLPTLLCQLVMEESGWQCVQLGPNTPMDSYVRAAIELKPQLVWISLSNGASCEQFLREYGSLWEVAQRDSFAVVLGGQAMSPAMRAQIECTLFGQSFTHLASYLGNTRAAVTLPRRGRPPIDSDRSPQRKTDSTRSSKLPRVE